MTATQCRKFQDKISVCEETCVCHQNLYNIRPYARTTHPYEVMHVELETVDADDSLDSHTKSVGLSKARQLLGTVLCSSYELAKLVRYKDSCYDDSTIYSFITLILHWTSSPQLN